MSEVDEVAGGLIWFAVAPGYLAYSVLATEGLIIAGIYYRAS